MSPHEARIVHDAQQIALGRADVRDHGVRTGGLKRIRHLAGQSAHRRAGEADAGAVERVVQALRHAVDRAELARTLEPGRVATEADDLGARDLLTRREADRAADQPDAEDGDLH